MCYSRLPQNIHAATSIIFCKVDDCSLEFLNGEGRHYYIAKGVGSKSSCVLPRAGLQEAITCVINGHHGTNMRQPHLSFVRWMTAALSS